MVLDSEVTLASLRQRLDEFSTSYQLIPHDQPIRSADEGVRFFGIAASQTAPALVLAVDGGFVVAIIPGDRRLDTEKAKLVVPCSSARLASRREVEQATRFPVGQVPLINIGMRTLVDRRLMGENWVYGGTGLMNWALKIDPAALVQVTQATICDIVG